MYQQKEGGKIDLDQLHLINWPNLERLIIINYFPQQTVVENCPKLHTIIMKEEFVYCEPSTVKLTDLPMLTTLFLEGGLSVKTTISECPNIYDLRLKQCVKFPNGMDNMNLRHLTLDRCYGAVLGGFHEIHQLHQVDFELEYGLGQRPFDYSTLMGLLSRSSRWNFFVNDMVDLRPDILGAPIQTDNNANQSCVKVEIRTKGCYGVDTYSGEEFVNFVEKNRRLQAEENQEKEEGAMMKDD